MVCSDNDTTLNITIPVVMIPKSGGEAINKSMVHGGVGEFIYSVKSFYLTLDLSNSVARFPDSLFAF